MQLYALMVDVQTMYFVQPSGSSLHFAQAHIAQAHHVFAMDTVALIQVVLPDSQVGQ